MTEAGTGVVQSSKEGLLSPPMQELMLHQSIYLERCAALKKILETSEDGPLEAGLHDVDCAWGELNAAFDSIKTTYELFLVLNSANAPPTHNMWFHLGGMKLSCVVRMLAFTLSEAAKWIRSSSSLYPGNLHVILMRVLS